ncbi:MAG: CotH kinase family protein [Anaerolineae bacterium]|nr:CotH kinase family protein [Anaerolineae bacterium]
MLAPAGPLCATAQEEKTNVRLFVVAGLFLTAITLGLGVSLAAEPAAPPAIRINEFLADNDGIIADEHGEYDDVLELYNAGTTSVDLGGMYLTDDLGAPTKFRITGTVTLPPGGFLLFWADSSPEQGIYHTNFALSKLGESIGLFDTDANGNAPLDTYSFGAHTTDVSEGRCPDGGQCWLFFSVPTMGASNEPCGTPPAITGTQHEPVFPQAGEAVTVTATITDDGAVIAATVWYSAGTGYLPVMMDGLEGDRYAAALPGQPRDTWVQYYIEAEDDAGQVATDPPGAPEVVYSYLSGYEAPPHRLFLPLLLDTGEPARLPLRLDCGSPQPYTAVDGTVYLADHAWSFGSYGYIGGYAYLPTEWWDWNLVGGTSDHDLYKAQRLGWEEYRVSRIPSGHYLLTLRFEEQVLHGPGLGVFNVAVEGQRVLDDFDVWARVGRRYALNRRMAVDVSDGELNVVASPVVGEARLSALELVAREPDSEAPAVPTGLVATASYHAILLDWADNGEDDLAGYHVYCAEQPEGPYRRLTTGEPAYLSRYQDRVTTTHVLYYYQVSAVDVYGNESAGSSNVSSAASEWADATLPLYQLEVSAENLALLYANPLSDDRVPGRLAFAGDLWPVEVRFRGSSTRYFAKKSWKIVFPGTSPFANQDRINVNANVFDPTLVHSKLATIVHEAAGVRPPENEHVLLALNGEYMGVYGCAEQVDEGFLLRTGRNPGASIYKVVDYFATILPNEAAYRAVYEKKTNEDLGHEDLISFIEIINYTPDDQFAAAIAGVMDVEAFLDYYAVLVLTADVDSARHNIYLVHDLDTGLWELVPWDVEITFDSVAAPIDMGTEEHPVAPGGSNLLRTRVLRVPEFRAYYCARLAEYMDTIFGDAVLHPQVDAVWAAVEQDGLRDWLKLEWEGNSQFMAAPAAIKAFITQRKEFLRGEMVTYCPVIESGE